MLLVDDARIRELNRTWRGKDAPTDVLSWPHHDALASNDLPLFDAEAAEHLLGDVAISMDTTGRQARARGWEDVQEASLLLLHGVLHLLGHEDETEAGARAMRAIEERILGKPLDVLQSPSAAADSDNGISAAP